MKKSIKDILFLTAVIAVSVVLLRFLVKCEDDVKGKKEPKVEIQKTPIAVTSLQEIGKWEFLAIEDDEIVDTVRKNKILSDDVLTRVYHGTVRIGVDMKKMRKTDITYQKRNDKLIVRLPKVGLLDKKFIDEANTDSYYESGKWSAQAYKALLKKAEQKMLKRCLTPANIKNAEQNGKAAAQQLFKSLGYDNVEVSFAQRES